MPGKRDTGLKLYGPGELKASDSWYIRGTYLGVTVFRSARTGRKSVAQKILRDIERDIEQGEIRSGRRPEKQETPTFALAALGYLQTCPDSQVSYVKKLLEYFGETPLTDCDQAAIDAYADDVYAGCAGSTINRNAIGPFAAVIHHAAEPARKLCPYLKVNRRQESKKETVWITVDQAADFLQQLPVQIETERKRRYFPRAYAAFLFGTGARPSEGVLLEWEDVDLQARLVRLRETKNEETYSVHLHPQVWEMMAALPHRTGRVFGFRELRRVYDFWNSAARDAGLKDFTPHCCRHSYATWHRMGGKDIRALMELGRWKDVKSVLRYTHVPSSEMREAVNALPLRVAGSVKNP